MNTERVLTMRPSADLLDAMRGIGWFNCLSPTERRYWLDVAGSAVPADAWAAYKRSTPV